MTWSSFYSHLFPGGLRTERAGAAGRQRASHAAPARASWHPCAHDGGVGGTGIRRGGELSWFNFGTIAAFLAWFGGTGYLLEQYYSVWFVVALAIAGLSGLGASSVVFWFLAKVLMAREAALDPADYDMIGRAGQA